MTGLDGEQVQCDEFGYYRLNGAGMQAEKVRIEPSELTQDDWHALQPAMTKRKGSRKGGRGDGC